MEKNRKKRGWAWGTILLAMLLLAYPLSVGPAIAIVGASGCHPTAIKVFQGVYAPLFLLPGIETMIQPWVDLWDTYGISRGGC